MASFEARYLLPPVGVSAESEDWWGLTQGGDVSRPEGAAFVRRQVSYRVSAKCQGPVMPCVPLDDTEYLCALQSIQGVSWTMGACANFLLLSYERLKSGIDGRNRTLQSNMLLYIIRTLWKREIYASGKKLKTLSCLFQHIVIITQSTWNSLAVNEANLMLLIF